MPRYITVYENSYRYLTEKFDKVSYLIENHGYQKFGIFGIYSLYSLSFLKIATLSFLVRSLKIATFKLSILRNLYTPNKVDP